MKVNAVESNDRRRTSLVPMVQGAAIGAAAGYVAKYVQPLAPQEKNNPEYKREINRINEMRHQYTPRTKEYLNDIKAKGKLSLAEDTFVKMFDGMKDGEKLKHGTIRNALKKIMEKNPAEVIEFRNICRDSSMKAQKIAKESIHAFNLATKDFRPTSFFVITGSIIGAFIALAHDVLRTDVKHK